MALRAKKCNDLPRISPFHCCFRTTHTHSLRILRVAGHHAHCGHCVLPLQLHRRPRHPQADGLGPPRRRRRVGYMVLFACFHRVWLLPREGSCSHHACRDGSQLTCCVFLPILTGCVASRSAERRAHARLATRVCANCFDSRKLSMAAYSTADEAHNIEDAAREAASVCVTVQDLRNTLDDLNRLVVRLVSAGA